MSANAPDQQPIPQRASIRIQDIPTEVLERLLGKYVQQVNETYKKKQGGIDVDLIRKAYTPAIELKSIESKKKRTIADVNSTFDINLEIADRLKYSDEMLQLQGFQPDIILSKSTTTDEPMAGVLRLALSEIMKESVRHKYNDNIDFEDNALSLMLTWTSQYFHLLTKRLQRLMEMQRRRLPNRNDLKLLSKEGYFNISGIHDMYDDCEKWRKQKDKNNFEEWEKVLNLAEIATTAFNGSDEGEFNTLHDGVDMEGQFWIDQLVHRKKRKTYIPEWMPPLPPDYTFKSTPKYSQRVKNPVILREKLVLEGRFGEKALDHIIVKTPDPLYSPLSEESISSSDDNVDVNNEIDIGEEKESEHKIDGKAYEETSKSEKDIKRVEAISSVEPITNTEANEEKTDQVSKEADKENKMDLVKIAHKRMEILERRRKQEEERILSRVESEESRLGRNFGFYTNIKKLPEDIDKEMIEFHSKKLRDLIHDLNKQEKRNAQWLIEQEELRKKLEAEKSKYAEANEIQIGGSGNDINDGINSQGYFFDNMDEEVDFDVEFSDIEDVGDAEAVKATTTDSAENIEGRGLSVRFDDKVSVYIPAGSDVIDEGESAVDSLPSEKIVDKKLDELDKVEFTEEIKEIEQVKEIENVEGVDGGGVVENIEIIEKVEQVEESKSESTEQKIHSVVTTIESHRISEKSQEIKETVVENDISDADIDIDMDMFEE